MIYLLIFMTTMFIQMATVVYTVAINNTYIYNKLNSHNSFKTNKDIFNRILKQSTKPNNRLSSLHIVSSGWGHNYSSSRYLFKERGSFITWGTLV